MTYKDSNPTFNTDNRKIVNYKDFIQHEPEEESELKKMKRQFKKADGVKAVNQDHQYKYNKVTHKNDDLVKSEVDDKLDALEEGIFSDRYQNESFSQEERKTLQEVMDEFYEEYETSYIDANTHGIIVKLIEELKSNGLIEGEWDDSLSGSN